MSLRLKDLRLLPLDRFCNFMWWWMTRNAQTEQSVEKVRATLWRPPPEAVTQPIDSRSPWSAEKEASAFTALKMGLGGE